MIRERERETGTRERKIDNDDDVLRDMKVRQRCRKNEICRDRERYKYKQIDIRDIQNEKEMETDKVRGKEKMLELQRDVENLEIEQK